MGKQTPFVYKDEIKDSYQLNQKPSGNGKSDMMICTTMSHTGAICNHHHFTVTLLNLDMISYDDFL